MIKFETGENCVGCLEVSGDLADVCTDLAILVNRIYNGCRRADVSEETAHEFQYCRRCIYLSRSGQATCDYIVLTGHMRGCPAGVGCDRRVNGERVRPSPIVSPARPNFRKEKPNGHGQD